MNRILLKVETWHTRPAFVQAKPIDRRRRRSTKSGVIVLNRNGKTGEEEEEEEENKETRKKKKSVFLTHEEKWRTGKKGPHGYHARAGGSGSSLPH